MTAGELEPAESEAHGMGRRLLIALRVLAGGASAFLLLVACHAVAFPEFSRLFELDFLPDWSAVLAAVEAALWLLAFALLGGSRRRRNRLLNALVQGLMAFGGGSFIPLIALTPFQWLPWLHLLRIALWNAAPVWFAIGALASLTGRQIEALRCD